MERLDHLTAMDRSTSSETRLLLMLKILLLMDIDLMGKGVSILTNDLCTYVFRININVLFVNNNNKQIVRKSSKI